MENEKKYYCLNSKTLATALNYVGFSYLRFNDKENPDIIMYSFEDTESFREALDILNELRRKNNKYKK
jgi:hypothetical protein